MTKNFKRKLTILSTSMHRLELKTQYWNEEFKHEFVFNSMLRETENKYELTG